MGTYAITGGSKGIGEQTVGILRRNGHEVVNIDIAGGDITVNLGTKEGRETAIRELHKRYPEGLNGFVSNAGIAGLDRFKPSDVLSVNYFGAVTVMEGIYDLLKMKKGNCVVTASGSIAYTPREKYFVDKLLTDCGDEERIGRFVNTFNQEAVGNFTVRIHKNGAGPLGTPNGAVMGCQRRQPQRGRAGAVATSIMEGTQPKHLVEHGYYIPMPTLYEQSRIMDPREIAEALAFFVQPGAKGCSGAVLFCDSGTEAILYAEKVY